MPATIPWFRFYCALLCLVYLALAAFGVACFIVAPDTFGFDAAIAPIMGILFTGMGLVFFFLSLLGFFMPRRSGGWTYCFVLICMGLTSAVFLPLCIPLLIFWLKPPTQEWFGRNPS